jgi:large subunit ribosomal protein L30
MEEKIKKTEDTGKLTAVIRIAGEVKKKSEIVETLDRLRLRKKYACTLINPGNKSLIGMIDKVKHSVAFGEIEKETLMELLKTRAQRIKEIGKKAKEEKIDSEKIAEELLNGKNLKELGLKPFFRMHPPRGGIKSKLQYPKGVLGDNKEDINKLIKRML